MAMRVQEAGRTVHPAALWFALVGGAVGWTVHFLVMYPLTPFACDVGSALPLHVATAVAALFVAVAVVVSWRLARRTAAAPADDAVAQRVRYMAVTALILNVAFLAVMLLTWMPVLLQDPCLMRTEDAPRAGLAAPFRLAVLGPTPALAHDGAPVPESASWRAWSADPLVLGALALLTWGYLCGLFAMWRRRGGRQAVPPARVAAFGAGVLAVVVAVLSPLDGLAEALFALHMIQHLLLVLVAAPLFVLAEPLVVLLWALPARGRLRLGRWWRGARAVPTAWRAVSHPVSAVLLHAVAIWAWHAPALYDAAVASRALHVTEHVCLLATGVLFWWTVVHAGALRGPGHGAAIMGVFVTATHGGALGALLTFAESPWYAAHRTTAPAWGLTPLEDQQLAGLIMWAPASLVYVGAGVALFVAWLREAERRAARRERAPAIVRTVVRCAIPAAVLAGLLGIGGCGTPAPVREVAGGDPDRGRKALRAYGCGGCHVVPGVRGATGVVAPPLTHFGDRAYIAGVLDNEPEHLVAWIQDPKGVHGRTAMPAVGVTEPDARDIAAYLYTLRRR